MISFITKKLYSADTEHLISVIDKIAEKAESFKSEKFINILVISEDKRFWEHCGFDFKAIIRATYNYTIHRKRSGASTITQQLVRTITNYRNNTFNRKIKEILLSIFIESKFNKKTIASSYLFLGYYGWRMNGIQQALDRLHFEN